MSQYKVPAVFFEDHCQRENLTDANEQVLTLDDVWVKTTGNYFIVELTNAQLASLRSDAVYNSEQDYAEYRGLAMSAKATVRWIDKQQQEGK